MKNKSLTALFLTAALIIGSVSILSGCAGTPAAETNVTAAFSADTTSEEVFTEPPEILPDLPEIKFDGYEMVFCVRGESFNEWESQDIYEEEQNGEPINDAVYFRNVFLEEKYDIKIRQFGASDVAASAKKAIVAGASDYDVIMGNTAETATTLASQGYLISLFDIPYLDTSKPWWDQRSVDQLSIGKKLYFMTGDLSIMANDATWILMFNKSMRDDYGLDNPYDLVYDNKWTYDKMFELMQVTASDLNGDGKNTSTDDQYGLATHDSTLEGLFFASGTRTVSKDENDIPYIDMYSERLVNVIDKANKIMADPTITCNASTLSLDMHTGLRPIFETGRALFFGEVMQCIIRLRTMEIDFGVLPFPKFNEAQEEYNHFIHTTACMVSIPMTNTELERTGIMLEAMAAKSKYTLQPAYYDICLDGKFMRDEESKGMLDIILATRNYDIGYIYNWGSLFTTFADCVKKGSTDFASKYTTAETKAQTAMEKTIAVWLGEE